MAVIKDETGPLEGHALLGLEDGSNPDEPTFRATCECGGQSALFPEARGARAAHAKHVDLVRSNRAG